MEKSEGLVVVLLLVAIALSIASVVMVNNNVSQSQAVSGKATDTGKVNASLDSMVSFTLTNATVDFGNVTQGAAYQTPTSVTGFTGPFGFKNTGTVILNMSLNANRALLTGSNSTFKYTSTCGGGCTGAGPADTYSGDKVVFGNMPFAEASDTGAVNIAIYVALDESAGPKTSTLTFTATQA